MVNVKQERLRELAFAGVIERTVLEEAGSTDPDKLLQSYEEIVEPDEKNSSKERAGVRCVRCQIVMRLAKRMFVCLKCGSRYLLKGNQWEQNDEWLMLEREFPGWVNNAIRFLFPDVKIHSAKNHPKKSRPPGWGTV